MDAPSCELMTWDTHGYVLAFDPDWPVDIDGIRPSRSTGPVGEVVASGFVCDMHAAQWLSIG